ncbi:MAG: 7TM diverse intracellular signaling domain-containing protein, partial [Rhodoferax sp.]
AHPGQFIERRAGDRLPFAAREVAHRGFVFKLNKTDDLTRTYYLRLQTSSTSLLVPRLSSPEAFHASSKVEYALLTGSLAMLLTVLMLDGVAAMYWRDATSKWFFAFLASMVLSNMNVSGFTAEYLLPDAPAVTDALTSLAALLVTTLGSGFYVRLYAIQPTQKIAYTLFQVGAWLPLLTMPTVYSGHYVLVVPWIVKLTLLLIVVGSWLSYRNWRSGASGGGWIFAANLISVLGYGVYNLSLGGILPWHLTPLYALQIATLGSVLTLHFALAARHRDMDQVRVDSEKLARAAELKAEMEHDNRLQQGKLLSMIAHEIRNALAVLRMAIGQQPMSAALIARADRAIHSMTSVIERTLQLERIA